MISQRLSNLSSNKDIFETAVHPYQKAIEKSGYKEKLQYSKNSQNNSKKRKNRSRKIIWFNPPFNQSVATNIGAKFLSLVKKHFEKSELKKFFNRKTLKLSYSCMSNIESIISNHNRKLLNTERNKNKSQNERRCNCRNGKDSCPLQGNCLSSSIIYKADIVQSAKTSSYIGLSSNAFKERFNNHVSSFNNEKLKECTSLSKYIWGLKEKNEQFKIQWSNVLTAPAYNTSSKTCHLCLMEKTFIFTEKNPNLLNKRSELLGKCSHRRKFLLSSVT